MKKLFKPASLLFNLLCLLLFFIVGMYFAGWIEAGKYQGLAGGAIVLGWGVLFAGIAFVGSFLLAYYLNLKYIKNLNWVLLILIIASYGYKYYQFQERDNRNEESVKEYPKKVTSTEASTLPISTDRDILKGSTDSSKLKFEKERGVGFFKPDFVENSTLYFYDGVNPENGILEHLPSDSIVFIKDEYGNRSTSHAPPWLYPEHLKLDYGICIFKTLSISQDFIKVEANSQTKRTTHFDKSKGEYLSWQEFLGTVNSIEFNELGSKKIHREPLDSSPEIKVEYDFMSLIEINEDWMYVNLVDENYNERGKGWIKWRENGDLLVVYSLLS